MIKHTKLGASATVIALMLGGGVGTALAQTTTPAPSETNHPSALCVDTQGKTKTTPAGFTIEKFAVAPNQIATRINLDATGLGNLELKLDGYRFIKSESSEAFTKKIKDDVQNNATPKELAFFISETNGTTIIDVQTPSHHTAAPSNTTNTAEPKTDAGKEADKHLDNAEKVLDSIEKILNGIDKAGTGSASNPKTDEETSTTPSVRALAQSTTQEPPLKLIAGEHVAGTDKPVTPGKYTVSAPTGNPNIIITGVDGKSRFLKTLSTNERIDIEVAEGEKITVEGGDVLLTHLTAAADSTSTLATSTTPTTSGSTTTTSAVKPGDSPFGVSMNVPQKHAAYKINATIEGIVLNGTTAEITQQGKATLDIQAGSDCAPTKHTDKQTDKTTTPTTPQQQPRPNVTSVPAGTIYR